VIQRARWRSAADGSKLLAAGDRLNHLLHPGRSKCEANQSKWVRQAPDLFMSKVLGDGSGLRVSFYRILRRTYVTATVTW